jgi:hypothetical protein
MTTALLIGAALVALACPLRMLWRMRRGGRASCLLTPPSWELETLRGGQEALADELDRTARG